jgi:hypothetical protein
MSDNADLQNVENRTWPLTSNFSAVFQDTGKPKWVPESPFNCLSHDVNIFQIGSIATRQRWLLHDSPFWGYPHPAPEFLISVIASAIWLCQFMEEGPGYETRKYEQNLTSQFRAIPYEPKMADFSFLAPAPERSPGASPNSKPRQPTSGRISPANKNPVAAETAEISRVEIRTSRPYCSGTSGRGTSGPAPFHSSGPRLSPVHALRI